MFSTLVQFIRNLLIKIIYFTGRFPRFFKKFTLYFLVLAVRVSCRRVFKIWLMLFILFHLRISSNLLDMHLCSCNCFSFNWLATASIFFYRIVLFLILDFTHFFLFYYLLQQSGRSFLFILYLLATFASTISILLEL